MTVTGQANGPLRPMSGHNEISIKICSKYLTRDINKMLPMKSSSLQVGKTDFIYFFNFD